MACGNVNYSKLVRIKHNFHPVEQDHDENGNSGSENEENEYEESYRFYIQSYERHVIDCNYQQKGQEAHKQ